VGKNGPANPACGPYVIPAAPVPSVVLAGTHSFCVEIVENPSNGTPTVVKWGGYSTIVMIDVSMIFVKPF
jgi:hypothetical protein